LQPASRTRPSRSLLAASLALGLAIAVGAAERAVADLSFLDGFMLPGNFVTDADSLALDPATSTFLVADGNASSADEITDTGAFVSNIGLTMFAPNGLESLPGGNFLALTGSAVQEFTRGGVATGIGFNLGGNAESVAYVPSAQRVLIGGADSLLEYDSLGNLQTTIDTGSFSGIFGNPDGLGFDPGSGLLFAVDRSFDSLAVFGAGGGLIETFDLFTLGVSSPESVSASGGNVYIGDGGDVLHFSYALPALFTIAAPVAFDGEGVSGMLEPVSLADAQGEADCDSSSCVFATGDTVLYRIVLDGASAEVRGVGPFAIGSTQIATTAGFYGDGDPATIPPTGTNSFGNTGGAISKGNTFSGLLAGTASDLLLTVFAQGDVGSDVGFEVFPLVGTSFETASVGVVSLPEPNATWLGATSMAILAVIAQRRRSYDRCSRQPSTDQVRSPRLREVVANSSPAQIRSS
jgi:hypothetical protein